MKPRVKSLPLRRRPVDIVFICFFAIFIVTCIVSDSVPALGIAQTPDSAYLPAQWNYWYSSANDPLYLAAPVWMRFITGTSAFVYGPFYLVLIYALARGRNWIQLPAVIYAAMIISLTAIPVFGTEFFGEAQYRTPQPLVFLLYNAPYVLVPLLLLIRMRKPKPFTRRF